MKVVEHLNKIPFTLGNKIGEGADGEVFELEDNKIIKFSILRAKDLHSLNYDLNLNKEIIKFIINNSSPIFAKIYNFDILEKRIIENRFNNYKRYEGMYYYIMEKLNPISTLESFILKNVIYTKTLKGDIDYSNHEYFLNLSREKLKEILLNLNCSRNLYGKIKFFHKHILLNKVRHMDINIPNIMKNNKGYFKLIDFDRCCFI